LAIEVMRQLILHAHQDKATKIVLEVHERVANYLNNRKRKDIAQVEEQATVVISILSRNDVKPEHLEFRFYDESGIELKNIQEPSNPKR
jgi:ribonuclease E